MKKYIAAMDIGTSGCKSIIIDEAGTVVASAAEEYPLYSPRPGWNEQDPDDWWRGAHTSLRAAVVKSGVSADQITVVGLSGQMHGLVAMDNSRRVIRRAFLWNDQRCAKQCAGVIDMFGGVDGILQYTNNNLLAGYQGGKILWLRENEPENYEKMAAALLPKDYVRFKLTGDYATEVSDASGTGFFDVKKRDWAYGLLEKLQIQASLFPRCVESDVITGTVSGEAAELCGLKKGTPVAGGGGDSVIQTTGMGLIEEGILGITVGTAGIVAMGFSQYMYNSGGKLQFFCNNAGDLYHVMGVMLAGGGSYQWHRNNLCRWETEEAKRADLDTYHFIDEAASLSPPGAKRLIYLPYLSGERSPYSDPNLRACFIGLTQTHTKGDMSRAIMESVTYGMRQISMAIQDLKQIGMSHIIVSGGGSYSPLWRQIISDIFQLPVITVSGAKDGGAFGACLVGGVAGGIWGSLREACGVLSEETRNDPNASNREIYDEMFSIYNDVVPALKPIFDRLAAEK
ncbi:MAG: xylulokinase [Synergistaceae bacterium]|jgi:xylulokinase|nr:xylulokinase [Synergistaceae bacterium]